MLLRDLRENEISILTALIKKAGLEEQIVASSFKCRDLDDGGMGSIELWPRDSSIRDRSFKMCIAEFETIDVDNVPVIISLNIDDQNELYELDIWKADFSRIVDWDVTLNNMRN